jgi:hypothetical protein
MTISNHFATGALIAYAIKQPYLAFPLAFVSHFALDVLPHYGAPKIKTLTGLLKRPSFVAMETLDLIGIISLVLLLKSQPYLLFGGLAAASPDIVWFYRLLKHKSNAEAHQNRLTHFHARIQWGEREWGIVIEIAYFIAIYSVLHQLLA